VAVAMKQVSQVPQRPSSINPQVSPALDAVVMRALEKEPGQRFQSADAFIAALDAALKDPGVAQGTAAFAAAPPVVAAPEDAGPPEDRKRNWWLWALLVAAILIGLLIGWALTRDTTTQVPNVTGNQLGVAITLLEQDGFTVGEVVRVERDAPANEVLEQDPAASPPADQASLDCAFISFFCSKPDVTLTVSSGPGSTEVPSTAGETLEQATRKLEAAGFEVAVERLNSQSVEEGLVISSEPGGGSTATKGSTVTLFVSRGPKLVRVPVLVGAQREVAVQRIRSRGLEPSVSEEESSSPRGQVISQSPDAGSEVERGSTISIVVSSGEEEEEQARVPNVIGKQRREAVEAIRAAGLQPSVEEEETSVPGQVGRVTDQFPPPGSELEPGETVTITVGKRAAEPVEEPEEGLEEE
jgi:serine/threonine-protein kinase